MRVATAVLAVAALFGGAMAVDQPMKKAPLEMTEQDMKNRKMAHDNIAAKIKAKMEARGPLGFAEGLKIDPEKLDAEKIKKYVADRAEKQAKKEAAGGQRRRRAQISEAERKEMREAFEKVDRKQLHQQMFGEEFDLAKKTSEIANEEFPEE